MGTAPMHTATTITTTMSMDMITAMIMEGMAHTIIMTMDITPQISKIMGMTLPTVMVYHKGRGGG